MSYEPHQVEWTPAKVGRVWDHYGSVEAFRPLYFSAHSGDAIVARADAELGLAGKRVLDFGSGHGDLLAQLFRRGISAHGLEFSAGSAAATLARFASEDRCLGIEVTDDLPSPYADGSFDVVFLVEVVEHLLDDQVAPTMRELARLLAPGGHVVATTPNTEELVHEQVHCPDCGATFHRWQHQRSLTADSLTALFSGFDVVRAEALDWGRDRRSTLRRLLRPRRGAPHLLYVGRRPDTTIPLPP